MLLPATLLICALAAPPDDKPKAFEFKDGDRIVWVGNTLVEREQRYGYWETVLFAANPGKNMTLRNLGWSGDTVSGEPRGRYRFTKAGDRFGHIVEQKLQRTAP